MTIGSGLKSVRVVKITVEQQSGMPFLTVLNDAIRMCLENQNADVVIHYEDGKEVRLSYWELIEHILRGNGIPFYPSKLDRHSRENSCSS